MKRNKNFYEGKFVNQYEKTSDNFILRLWHKYSLSSRHIRAFNFFENYSNYKKGLVLDYGCGGGNLNYLKLGDVYGVDISKESVVRAKDIYTKAMVFDGKKIPFKDNFFDKVVCSQVFGHISFEEKDSILKEIKRVSRNGATFLFNIEADSKGNKIIDFMKKDRKLYKKYWIDMYGHDGLEISTEIIKRFNRNSFKVEVVLPGLKYIWEPGAYVEVLGKEYADNNLSLGAWCALMSVVNSFLPLKVLYLFVGGVFSFIFEKNMDVNKCTGVSIIGRIEKK